MAQYRVRFLDYLYMIRETHFSQMHPPSVFCRVTNITGYVIISRI